jgi:hypothetical protein
MAENKKNGLEKKKVSHTKRNVGIIVLLVLVVGIGLFYNFYLSGGVIKVVSLALSNPTALKATIIQKINSTPQLTLAYTGTIKANVTPPNGADPLVSIPITLNYVKYYNDTRINFTLVGNQSLGIGSVSAVAVEQNDSSEVSICYNLNNTGYQCAASGGNETQIIHNLTSELNISDIGNLAVKGATPSFYNGQSCWAVTGTGTISGNSRIFEGGNATMSFSACISPQYYVPLTFMATITEANGNNVLVNITATNVSHVSSGEGITSLP